MLKKNDFIELEFSAKIKETGQMFDTNIQEKAKELGVEKVEPLKICIGEGMVLKGFDSALEGKEVGKSYDAEINSKDAFGPRNPGLVKIIPLSIFLDKNVNPYPGMVLDLDGIIARIISVTSGRVMTDFNNPLSGKTVIYSFKVLKKLEDKNECLKILSLYYLGTDKFEMESDKAVFLGQFNKNVFDVFAKKAKDFLNIDVESTNKKKVGKDAVEVNGIKISKA